MRLATDLIQDLASKVKDLPWVAGRCVSAMSLDDLHARVAHLPKPAIGILYEGARALPSPGGSASLGVSGEIVFSILLLVDGATLAKVIDVATPAHGYLDDMRAAIHGGRAPTGNFWKWVIEAPATVKGTQAVWLQRWSTPIQLTPSQRTS